MQGWKFFIITLLSTIHSTVAFVSVFSPTNAIHPSIRSSTKTTGPVMVIPALAKKAKQATIDKRKEMIETQPEHPVMKKMEELAATKEPKASTLIRDALKKPNGTLSLVAEYRRKLKSGFIQEMLEPYFLSRVYRMAGAKTAAVYIDENVGGATLEDLKEIVDEQASCKGEYPGPMPVVAHDLIISEYQLAEIAATGADGVTLSLPMNGAERTAELKLAAEKLGLETIAQVTNAEEIGQAADMGFTMIGIKANTETLHELYKHIPEGTLSIAFLDRYSDEGLSEIEDAWSLRAIGYNTVWVGDIIYKGGMEHHESTKAIIKAFLAKTSVNFGRATGKSGKGEGAKEYLGTLLM
mmetsp:Transcript_35795/g.47252  ORF Transcript_35795/g.47252 Transcript_35795/m.47252 type:complete len:353 (-) Transcript_35795:393-1451(-)